MLAMQRKPRLVLEQEDEDAAPHGRSSDLSLVSVNAVPVMLAAARVDIDLADLAPADVLPEVTANPEDKDNWESEVSLEEVVGGAVLGVATNWCDGGPELRVLLVLGIVGQ
jgi:hypothetical protein